MRFWDSSALVPLIVGEPRTRSAKELLEADRGMFVWWATEIECTSAVARLERSGVVTAAGARTSLGRLADLIKEWTEVEPGDTIRATARRVVRLHELRAADAFQLAAAVEAAEGNPASLPLVTLDRRLARAAELEGFNVVEPEAPAR